MKERICTCKHHFSAHTYDPKDQGRAPPKTCVVQNCGCTCFVDKRAAKREKQEAEFQARLEKMRQEVRNARS